LSVASLEHRLSLPSRRARLTNTQTGSTFLLRDEGLYVVRRPDDEWIKRFRDQAYEN